MRLSKFVPGDKGMAKNEKILKNVVVPIVGVKKNP
jgi:hypothetical protein